MRISLWRGRVSNRGPVFGETGLFRAFSQGDCSVSAGLVLRPGSFRERESELGRDICRTSKATGLQHVVMESTGNMEDSWVREIASSLRRLFGFVA